MTKRDGHIGEDKFGNIGRQGKWSEYGPRQQWAQVKTHISEKQSKKIYGELDSSKLRIMLGEKNNNNNKKKNQETIIIAYDFNYNK